MSYVSSIELRKVRPEAVNEKSVLESVVDLFHDVVEKVPQAYSISSRSTHNDQFETIEWIRFLSNAHEWHPSIRIDTLVLLIAYKSGLSLWTIENNGIANELFSIREHNLSSVCLLIPNIYPDDSYYSQHPLLAFAKSAGPPSIQIRSLKNDQKPLKIINLPGIGSQSEPLWIESNTFVLICATHTFIIGYDLIKFDEKFFITNCYSSIPYALSTRWLAFVDYRLYLIHQSLGGIDGTISEQYISYAGAMLNAAKSLSKSVVKIGESFLGYGNSGLQQLNNTNMNDKTISNQTQSSSTTINNSNTNSTRHRHGSTKDESQPGIVTIVDTIKLFGSSVHDERQNWIIAHFQAHTEPVSHLQFNPSGHLLVTCDTSGHYFNVLEIQASPYRCTRTYIKHLYTLFRGDTDCIVSHMTFTTDSRWLAVSTKRGTTHLFAINPYGGVANVRTHTKPYVVNKTNRYHRTVGLDEQPIRQTNNINNDNGIKNLPLSPLTNSSSNIINGHNNNYVNSTRTKRINNECIFSTAVTLIRQPTESFVSGLSAPFNIDSLCLAAIFGISRGFLNPEDMINHQEHTSRACNSLFIISWHGRLIEYVLEPKPDITKHGTRVTSETPLALTAIPKAQWKLQKLITWPEVRMSVGYSFLSQGQRPTSGNKVHSKDDWLRQVEMNTHVGPHRRLWMGPQFQFKHYSEATVSVCHPNSNVFTADAPQTSMNIVDADLNSLPMEWSKSTPVYVPNMHKEISPAYIEVGSGSFQDAPSLSIYGSSLDSLKSDLEVELVEKLADAAIDIPSKNVTNGDTTDSLSSSSCSSTVVRSLQANPSVENMIQFPDTADQTY
ncbi:unnamed protein product [Rotaria sp. Silwood1]|nr:unnamed protein product [Rotaria sp. Silwood1]CAF0957267.1 unnamed protein product [Rotaria sp. Silwood1]CAF3369802.1 unnamed protein product [Rotaria sp. Silwood1]CAF3374032.1 unnamed protein product [Rotaria sp. Silwood1]CAF4574951.1 unnamed protein product [Rotaria sp. Silwood1]